jgi:hypothetical protein
VISNAAGYFVVRKVQADAALSRSRWRGIVNSFHAGELDGLQLAEEMNKSVGDLGGSSLSLTSIEWPGYYRFVLPLVLAKMYSREKRIWRATKSELMPKLNPSGNPSIDQILLEAFSRNTLTSVRILKYYLLWLLAFVIGAAALLVISYVLLYVPLPSQL